CSFCPFYAKMLKTGQADGRNSMERLDKILANTGRWSRKEARELIRAGRVSVDGVTARAPEDKADPAAVFTVDGERISGEKQVHLLLPADALPVHREDG